MLVEVIAVCGGGVIEFKLFALLALAEHDMRNIVGEVVADDVDMDDDDDNVDDADDRFVVNEVGVNI